MWAYFLVLSNVLDPEMVNKALQMGMDQFLEQNPEASQDMINQVESMQEQVFWTDNELVVFSL